MYKVFQKSSECFRSRKQMHRWFDSRFNIYSVLRQIRHSLTRKKKPPSGAAPIVSRELLCRFALND